MPQEGHIGRRGAKIYNMKELLKGCPLIYHLRKSENVRKVYPGGAGGWKVHNKHMKGL